MNQNEMRILFIGDSITRGKLGVCFVQMIRKAFPAYQIKNLGVDGDTLDHISARLFQAMQNNPNYDCIVLQGGYNDVFLPHFDQKGKLFRFALKEQLKKGLVPLVSATEFESHLRATVKKIKEQFTGTLVLTTMGCINELQHTELNAKRRAYNNAIRTVAREEEVLLADCGDMIDRQITHLRPVNYFLESFWAVTITDRLFSRIKGGADFLSRKRQLHFTIDGVHLNTKGAAIFSDCISKAIRQLEELKNVNLLKNEMKPVQ